MSSLYLVSCQSASFEAGVPSLSWLLQGVPTRHESVSSPHELNPHSKVQTTASDITCAKYTCILKSFASFRFGEDELFSNYDSPDILVLRNGHYYTFPVIDAEGFNCFSPLFVSFGSSFRVPLLGVLGKVITPSEIKAHLKYILDDPTPANEFPVGIMTSQDRDVWAATRRKLVEERKQNIY